MLPFYPTRKQPGKIDEIADTLHPATIPTLSSTMTLLSLTNILSILLPNSVCSHSKKASAQQQSRMRLALPSGANRIRAPSRCVTSITSRLPSSPTRPFHSSPSPNKTGSPIVTNLLFALQQSNSYIPYLSPRSLRYSHSRSNGRPPHPALRPAQPIALHRIQRRGRDGLGHCYGGCQTG
jgi:hypothetical protein